jgi:hypothetical protein
LSQSAPGLRRGIATARWTLSTQPRDNVVIGSTERLTTQLTFTATGVVGAAAIVQKRSGDGQTATSGRPVDVRPSVTVTDQVGNPVVGVAVMWAVLSGGGQISGAKPVTGSEGVATLLEWILGAGPGPNAVTATVQGLPAATFTATGVAGPALVTVIDGDGQTAEAGTPVAPERGRDRRRRWDRFDALVTARR